METRHMRQTLRRFRGEVEPDIRGYRVEGCLGGPECPNSLGSSKMLLDAIQDRLESVDVLGHLRRKVHGTFRFHHEFRVALSECPNGCSRPPIADIGLVAVHVPAFSKAECSHCESCVRSCPDNAITLEKIRPRIHRELCAQCGRCIAMCPTETLIIGTRGFRVLVGGKLGRHPQLGRDLGRVFSEDEIPTLVERCIRFHLRFREKGERFGEVLKKRGIFDMNQGTSILDALSSF